VKPRPDPVPDDVARALEARAGELDSFANVRFFSEVDSTNDIALTAALDGAPEGTTILAETQRAGRGRRGHTWFSPPGAGLYLSTVVRTALAGGHLSLITIAAGVAVAEAVKSVTGLPVELKWPNDVVVGRPWRKIAGLLGESVGAGAVVDAVVIGIGINLRTAAYPPEIAGRATSIETELGRAVERAPLVAELLVRLRARVGEVRDGRRGEVCDAWRRYGRASLAGAVVRWHNHDLDQEHRGIAKDIDEDGALLVERDGRVERLVAGEIVWEELPRE
jgi:BirA family biotin operon repressor/biotin-[acetyl-CoA-carboxylase] ligase